MSDLPIPADETASSVNGTGVYFAVLQLVFTLGWTTYLIYLPMLAAQVGIAPSAVILILMMDQAIFTVTDTAMGIAADRIAPVVGRLGAFVGALTALSCAAFVALPFVAGAGHSAHIWLIVLIVIWAVTSSALRAPPLTLLGRYGAKPSIPFLSALVMLGYGVAGALSPYLGAVLRDHDPRLPFVISSGVLLITALALSRVERGLVRESPSRNRPVKAAKPLGKVPVIFIVAMVLLALGYQLHFSINSAPFYLRLAKPGDLQWLMPVFWIGFNIALFPASAVTKRRGGLIVMGAAGLLGALAILAAERAGSLNVLIVTIHRGRGLGLHADERDLGGAGDRRQRRGRQGVGSGIFRIGARDLRADGGGRGRPAKVSRIRALVKLGADRVLVGRRRGPIGDGGVVGSATRAGGERGVVYGFAGWMNAHGLISESLGTSMAMT
jgi:MFS family permease